MPRKQSRLFASGKHSTYLLLELGLSKENVLSHDWIILHELQLVWQIPWIFLFDIKVPCPS